MQCRKCGGKMKCVHNDICLCLKCHCSYEREGNGWVFKDTLQKYGRMFPELYEFLNKFFYDAAAEPQIQDQDKEAIAASISLKSRPPGWGSA